ncbi:MAG: L-threonylcarbamoyladenylate synthase [Salinivenus sp.]
MDTHLTTSPDEAAQYVREGHLAAFPTETVYGLGADAFQPSAVQSIFTAKGRPADNPLIVHLVARAQLRQVASAVPPVAETLLNRFAPGPLTLILPRAEAVPGIVTAGLDTVGVRFPVHDRARAFLRACDTPVAAPSANRSGRPSPTHWTAVQEDLGGRIACILKGGRTEAGVESTVLDCTASPPTVLRPGAISVEQLRHAVGAVDVADGSETDAARSPGTKHRHYAPAASVRLVQSPAAAEPGSDAAYIGLEAPTQPEAFRRCRVADDVEAYARDLFHFFRACDRADCSRIYAQVVAGEGLGRALNDRLQRAAAR